MLVLPIPTATLCRSRNNDPFSVATTPRRTNHLIGHRRSALQYDRQLAASWERSWARRSWSPGRSSSPRAAASTWEERRSTTGHARHAVFPQRRRRRATESPNAVVSDPRPFNATTMSLSERSRLIRPERKSTAHPPPSQCSTFRLRSRAETSAITANWSSDLLMRQQPSDTQSVNRGRAGKLPAQNISV